MKRRRNVSFERPKVAMSEHVTPPRDHADERDQGHFTKVVARRVAGAGILRPVADSPEVLRFPASFDCPPRAFERALSSRESRSQAKVKGGSNAIAPFVSGAWLPASPVPEPVEAVPGFCIAGAPGAFVIAAICLAERDLPASAVDAAGCNSRRLRP